MLRKPTLIVKNTNKMGNCFHRCFGVVDRRRRFIRSKYEEENDFSIEFENLMDEEPDRGEMSRLLTDRERQLLNGKQFDTLIEEQREKDAQTDQKLASQEEELAREEEAFHEAKREAAAATRLARERARQSKGDQPKGWPDNGSGGGDDDFEVFLANVKARSLATRSQVMNGSGDGHSSSSSPAPTRDRTDGSSSLDMEWDHEAGMSPHRRPLPAPSRASTISASNQSPMHSSDLEWEPDFVSADTEHLVTAEVHR